MKKNIVLIGASNSRIPGGLQAGLDHDDVNFFNLSIGGTTSLHKLYCLKRKKNQEILNNADLIIIESNIMDTSILNILNVNLVLNNICYLYDELATLRKKILILFLFEYRNIKSNPDAYAINNLHKYKANEYGFNIIDVDLYIKEKNMEKFYMQPDPYHMISAVMFSIGRSIIKNINSMIYPYKTEEKSKEKNQFETIELEDFSNLYCYENKINMTRDLIYKEKTLTLDKDVVLEISNKFIDYRLIGMHTFNNSISNYVKEISGSIYQKHCLSYSSLMFENSKIKLIKPSWGYNSFVDIATNFIIEKNTILKFNTLNKHSELSWEVGNFKNYINTLEFSRLVSLLVVKDNNQKHYIDFGELSKEVFADNKINCNYLIPDLQLIKDSIEEYNIKMDPRKLAPLQNQIKEKDNIIFTLNQEKTTLQNELNSIPVKKQNLEIKNLEQDLKNKELQSFVLKKELGNKFVKNININYIDKNSAKSRIQNHLSYKLGQALITNSKSILGYIRMPFVLS
ncbi:TPA: SGNH/GDSL hydrolase family protein, partial [Campylobacter jejuni]|nr:SGNH/GDSL hydrolase family protein [Campylobacter jejuni]